MSCAIQTTGVPTFAYVASSFGSRKISPCDDSSSGSATERDESQRSSRPVKHESSNVWCYHYATRYTATRWWSVCCYKPERERCHSSCLWWKRNYPMNIISFNCRNFFTNNLYVKYLVNSNDIIYIAEHWLRPNEQFELNNFSASHKLIFESDIPNNCKKAPGRPYGGRCWLVRNTITIVDYEIFNDLISLLRIRLPNQQLLYLFEFDTGQSALIKGSIASR